MGLQRSEACSLVSIPNTVSASRFFGVWTEGSLTRSKRVRSPQYLQHYLAINAELTETVERIAADLRAADIACVLVPASVRDEQLDREARNSLTVPVSHKMVAARARLGWIGKTDLLVSYRVGPRVRLASILTTATLEVAVPVEVSHRGDCSLCVEACPAKAATGSSWHGSMMREQFFDGCECRDYQRRVSWDRP
jgi:epoxyqueuosine reductase QueG